MENRFSVLMSVYRNDKPDYVKVAVESVLNQTLKASDIVIVIDGPVGDDILFCLRSLADAHSIISLFELRENVGLAAALNFGISKCRYELVARMDADDVALPDRFQKTVPVLAGNCLLSIVGGQHKVFSCDMSSEEGVRSVPLHFDDIKKFARLRTPINHPTIVFRKSHIVAWGGYPEDIGRFEDWGLALRAINCGGEIHNVPDVVLHVRGGYEMLRRRHGVLYLIEEFGALNRLYRQQLLGFSQFILNVIFRSPLRLIPRKLLRGFYAVALRR